MCKYHIYRKGTPRKIFTGLILTKSRVAVMSPASAVEGISMAVPTEASSH